MAIVDITKPMALDETLQGTNTKMDAVILKLQGIIDALGLDTSVYKPKGNITCAALVPALLIDDNLGNVYNVTNNGTTTSDFVEGAGKPIHVGDNVAIVDIGTGGQSEYKFDLLAGMVDLTNYVQKSATPGLLKNDGTVDTKDYAEKVAGATNGNLAGLNGSGNPTDSGISGDMTTQSVSGNPISIADLKSAQIALNPVITFEPIQAGSGTPSPSNIRAISGYDKIEVLSCGKNLFPEDKLANVRYNEGVKESLANAIGTNGYIVVKANTAYYFSISASSRDSNCRVFWYDKNYNVISYDTPNTGSKVYTSPATAHFATIYWEQADSPARYANDFLFCEDSITDKTYEPYHKTTDLSESLGQTVYYGRLNVRTGEFTVLGKAVDMGNLEYAYYQSSDFFYASTTSMPDVASEVSPSNSWCEIYPIISATQSNPYILWNGTQLRIYYTGYTDAATFKNAMIGYKLVYPISNPFTIQLTPHEIALSQGYNYISTNGTSISLAYHNGEMASLADVSQLGETLNALGDSLKNVDVKVYYSGSNENWKIYRIGRIRILTAWNCPVGKMLTYVDDIDKPIEVYDSAMILIDSRMARFRIQADGGIGCQYIYSYGGSAASYTTSSTEKVFTSFAYVAKE